MHSFKPSKSSIAKEFKMSYENQLRVALSQAKEGKDISREAGAGVWANYVRATCYPYTPSNVEELDSKHKEVVEQLEAMKELSKEEKNSLRSAKSVIGKAISNGVNVWKLNDSGTIETDDSGNPMPKGKSELQETKSDFDRMMAFFDGAEKKWNSETREVFTAEELATLWGKIALLADAILQAKQEQ
jgi:transposase-like protein